MDEVVTRALGERAPEIGSIDPQPIVEHLDTADRHKDAGVHLRRPTRFASLKGLVLRVARVYTTEQAAYNHAALAALHTLNRNIDSIQVDVDQRLARTQALMSSAEVVQQDLVEEVERLRDLVTALEATIARLADERSVDRTELAVQRSRVDLLLEEARRRLPEPFDDDQLRDMSSEVGRVLEPLYAQLEERFRGSRSDVIEMQKAYLPDVVALPPGSVVVDIGCGRGEWLELLRDNGITAYGVDTNEGFVARNLERGLDVRHGDALEHLAALEDASLGAVTGFHIVEHLEFPLAVRLVDAALRALRPGGFLLFETPNPTNVIVGSSAFYLDPTHRNPVHPQFLQFLLESRGFVDVEVRYLHPSMQPPFTDPGPSTEGNPSLERMLEHLNWAFFGPLDYAVIGRKPKARTS